jgi:hypothetical protein
MHQPAHSTAFAKPGLTVTLAVLASSASLAHADPESPGVKMYDEVKHVENQIKDFPKKEGTVHMGTYNMDRDLFQGYWTPEDEVDYGNNGPGPVQKPKVSRHKPVVIPIDAVEVTLSFGIKGYDGPWTIQANGHTTKVPAGQHEGSVFVGTAIDVTWTIFVHGKLAVTSRGKLSRPPGGAGAFIVPAIPVTVLYAPPLDSHKRTFASYSETKSAGNAVTVSFSDSSSAKKADNLSQFAASTEFRSVSTKVASALGGSSNEYAQAAGTIIGLLGKMVESVEGNQEAGTKTTREHALRLGISASSTFRTQPQAGGPGHGDRIFYLKKARVGWVVAQTPGTPGTTLSLVLMGHDALASYTVDELKNDLAKLEASPPAYARGQVTGLPVDAIKNLISLDPFAHDPDANLDDHRFAFHDEYDGGTCGPDKIELTRTSLATDRNAETKFRVRIDEYSRGFWAAIGMGGDPNFEDKTVVTTTSHSALTEQTSSSSSTATLMRYCAVGEHLGIRVFYDKVFGTFAFKDVPQGEVRLAGTVKPNSVVKLSVGGRTVRTKADASGNYTFRSSSIPARIAGTLNVDGVQKPVQTL